MNCLQYALEFWSTNPCYTIHYNSDHCINLPKGETATGFLPIEDFGYEHISKSFAGKVDESLLIKYFEK